MKPRTQVVVRWRNEGALFENGIAYPRGPGNEDVMDWKTAKALIGQGRCKLVGEAKDIPRVSGSVDTVDTTCGHEDE